MSCLSLQNEISSRGDSTNADSNSAKRNSDEMYDTVVLGALFNTLLTKLCLASMDLSLATSPQRAKKMLGYKNTEFGCSSKAYNVCVEGSSKLVS